MNTVMDETDAATSELLDNVESALDLSGFPWKRRELGWAIPAGPLLAREIQILPEADGVCVRAALVEWDEIGSTEAEALRLFLTNASKNLRFASCEVVERQARVTAAVEFDELETKLPDAVGAVAAGVKMLTRETGALLVPTAAAAFLNFMLKPGSSASAGR